MGERSDFIFKVGILSSVTGTANINISTKKQKATTKKPPQKTKGKKTSNLNLIKLLIILSQGKYSWKC